MPDYTQILPTLSKNISGLSWAGGIIFLFLGFFDIGDFKSVTRSNVIYWQPVLVGSFLMIIGLLLHIFKLPDVSVDPEKKMSRGLIYILRHMDVDKQYKRDVYFAYHLYVNNSINPSLIEFTNQRKSWQKAAGYALCYLSLLGVVKRNETEADSIINEKGEKLLKSITLRQEYNSTFSKDLVSKVDADNAYRS